MKHFLLLCLLILFGNAPAPARAGDAYLLGVGDRLSLRAIVWNEDLRAFEGWASLGGEYAVQSDGSVAVPLAGPIPAEGHSTAELAEAIGSALGAQVGMKDVPRIAVEVIGYRPFYVVGDVSHPGAYPGAPGLTALQAVALAGGFRGTDTVGSIAQGESLRNAGALRGVLNDIARARARQARLEAVVSGEETLEFPHDLSHPDGPRATAQLINEERAIFAANKAGVERELASLADLDQLLNTEVSGLDGKLAGLAVQMRMARETLANLTGLNERGFASGTNLANAQRGLIDLEGKDTDLRNSLFRARQRITENQRDIIELSARQQTEATIELQRVKAELEKLGVTKSVLEQVMVVQGLGAVLDAEGMTHTTYEVTRAAGAGETTVEAIGPGGQVRPGDVLTVTTEFAPVEQGYMQ